MHAFIPSKSGFFIYCNISILTLSLVRETRTAEKNNNNKKQLQGTVMRVRMCARTDTRLLYACSVIIFDGQGQLCHINNLCKRKRSFKPCQNEHDSLIEKRENHEKMRPRIENSNGNFFPPPTCISFRPSYPRS